MVHNCRGVEEPWPGAHGSRSAGLIGNVGGWVTFQDGKVRVVVGEFDSYVVC